MAKEIVIKMGLILLMIAKGLIWTVFTVCKFALGLAKVILLLLGLVMRIFLVFVRVGTT